MGWTAVSDGAGKGSNEDLVAVHERDGVTDVLVLDGATSVAERDYADRAIGDVAWFVRRFAREAQRLLGAHEDVAAVVDAAVGRTRAAYLERVAGQAVPDHAWPIAALTWTRVRHGAGLAHACLERGLAAMLAELRAAEAAGRIGGMPLKAADDASAVLWTR